MSGTASPGGVQHNHPTDVRELIINNLQIISKNEPPFKRKYYLVAINHIKQISLEELVNKVSFLDIPGIGKKINDKIIEVRNSGKNLDNVNQILDDIENTLDLTTVYGIGPSLKTKIESKYGKVRNIAHLIELDAAAALTQEDGHGGKPPSKTNFLNSKNKIGLKYYNDLLMRIPRNEMHAHDKYISDIINNNHFDLTYDISGSYRRECSDSGDIDILLTHTQTGGKSPKGTNLTDHYKSFVDCLKLKGYIVDDLAYGNTKYMGVCKLPHESRYRRIDIIVTKPEEYYFELIYFTGSDEFNKEMRRHALTIGYSMSQYNFTDTETNKTIEQEFHSEKDIFAFLNLKYVKPKNRKSGALVPN